MMKKLLAIALLTPLPAAAQPAPISIYFAFGSRGTYNEMVDAAIHAVQERPEILAAAKRDAAVLEITILGRVTRDPGDNAKGFNFTLGFYRGGDKLGESVEACRLDQLAECAEQIASDIASANQIRH
jgi:hypothetical protein